MEKIFNITIIVNIVCDFCPVFCDTTKDFRKLYKIWNLKTIYKLIYHGYIVNVNDPVYKNFGNINRSCSILKEYLPKGYYLSEILKKNFREKIVSKMYCQKQLVVENVESVMNIYLKSIRFIIHGNITRYGSIYFNTLIGFINDGTLLNYMRNKYVLEDGSEIQDNFNLFEYVYYPQMHNNNIPHYNV